ncbi:DUF6074 family protein [Pseudooceanicola sp. 502str34]
MAEIFRFPESAKADPERRIPVWQHMGAGPSAELVATGETLVRWFRFCPRDAAVLGCAIRDRAETVAWWRAHLAEVRAHMRASGLPSGRIDEVVKDYTALVRAEVAVFRNAKMSADELRRAGCLAAIHDRKQVGDDA